ncbi:MAG TPA: IPT/TIG domain-containing protein [Nitrospirales bacterium]|jgi:hypothetical protein
MREYQKRTGKVNVTCCLTVLTMFGAASFSLAEKPAGSSEGEVQSRVTASPESVSIAFEHPLHFVTGDGADITASSGMYFVEAGPGSDVRLTPEHGGKPLRISALSITHDEKIASSLAMLIPRGEDEEHLVLLLPDGKGLDAAASRSGIRSRATMLTSPVSSQTVRQFTMVQPAYLAAALAEVDPCAGATTQTGTAPIAASAMQRKPGLINKNPYPGAGTGPIPDVTDWQPRTRIAANAELTIQGRNMVPNNFVAMIGDTRLIATTQSSSEIRFRAPAQPVSVAPLVVYQQGGQVRTLDAGYMIFDPTVTISRVVPIPFGNGDIVTVCGRGLFQAKFSETRLKNPDLTNHVLPAQPQWESISVIWVGQTPVQISNPTASASGDRLTFVVGDALELITQFSQGGNNPTIVNKTTLPPSVAGVFRLQGPSFRIHFDGNVFSLNDTFAGPGVTWQLSGPKIRKVYGRFFGKQEPFVILPSSNAAQSSFLFGSAAVEGGNLYGSYRIGNMNITGFSIPPPEDGTSVWLTIPTNASSGPICATKNNQTTCTPSPLQVFGAPVISSMPTMPLALRVTHTIQGLNLLPPNIAGLTYRFDIFGLDADPATGIGSVNTSCNQVLEVLEHTANRIVFRVGDPTRTAPLPSGCGTGPRFQQSSDNKMWLWATYQGQTSSLLSQPYYLKNVP